ncbi:MAG: serine--tRNA ligase, partial [Actinomycetota bacterium]|nr:serine--tRNA ligase [Actinomycetota bacterium]
MIDLKLVRDDPTRARSSQRLRGGQESLVDALLAADDARRAAVARADNLRAQQKTASRAVGQAGPDERPALLQ